MLVEEIEGKVDDEDGRVGEDRNLDVVVNDADGNAEHNDQQVDSSVGLEDEEQVEGDEAVEDGELEPVFHHQQNEEEQVRQYGLQNIDFEIKYVQWDQATPCAARSPVLLLLCLHASHRVHLRSRAVILVPKRELNLAVD